MRSVVAEAQQPGPKPVITVFPAIAIVIGSVVGSGIFVSSADIAKSYRNGPFLLAVWAGCGLLTMMGALCVCELAALMPKVGGLYVYLHRIYGRPMGFFYGWANFIMAGSGAIAAIAFTFGNYAGEFINTPSFLHSWESIAVSVPLLGIVSPFKDLVPKVLASGAVALLTLLNVCGIKPGVLFQTVSTSVKTIAIVLVVGIAFGVGSKIGSFAHLTQSTSSHQTLPVGWWILGAVSVALSAALWSYDGWINIAYVADDVREPERTIPRSIVWGTILFTSLYILVNLAYLFILSIDQIADAQNGRVASVMANAVVGPAGGVLIAILIMVCTFDATNAVALTNARVYYAMAKEGMFWNRAGFVHSRFGTPHVALICQGIWSIALIMTNTFDSLFKMYVWVNWLIYILVPIGVFLLRNKHPENKSSFRVPWYPWTPALFAVLATTYVVVMLISDIQAYINHKDPQTYSVIALVMLLIGIPLYRVWAHRRSTARME